MRDRNAPLTEADIGSLDWNKVDGLIPAIVQDAATRQVLMLGFMSREALTATLRDGRATFYSRTRQRLWQKGETSGHFLAVRSVHEDCDGDTLLILADPAGPTCHFGTESCFGGDNSAGAVWLDELSRIVNDRRTADAAESYTARLLRDGPVRIAQKVGEEAVELALAAALGDNKGCIEEAADLLYHLAVLMEARGFSWSDVSAKLRERHR